MRLLIPCLALWSLLFFARSWRERPKEMESPHFQLSYYGLSKKDAKTLLDTLEQNRQRIMDHLGAREMPRVEVRFLTAAEVEERWTPIAEAGGLTFEIKGLTVGRDEIHINGPWALKNRKGALRPVVVHELAHLVTLAAAYGPGVRPTAEEEKRNFAGLRRRWLWEAVACYEAGQSSDLRRLDYIRNGDFPTLRDLDRPSDSRIYQLGYSLIAYVESRWGGDAVARLVRAQGDIPATLGISEEEFEEGWRGTLTP